MLFRSLVEKLGEVVTSGHKVVIFSQFVTLLDRVRTALDQHYPELPRYEITGMTVDRQKPVKDFQSASGAAAMLVSLKAAGTGITLHAADYVFLLDPWWNPAVEAQAVDRVHRIGQTNTVFVYRMVTAGTRRLQEKMCLFWHDHFACNQDVVKDALWMSIQNRVFRQFGLRLRFLDAVRLGLIHDTDFETVQLGINLIQHLGRDGAIHQRVVDVIAGQVALLLGDGD